MALIWAALSGGFTNGPLAAEAVSVFSTHGPLKKLDPKKAPNVISIVSSASKISIGPRRRWRVGCEVGVGTMGCGGSNDRTVVWNCDAASRAGADLDWYC